MEPIQSIPMRQSYRQMNMIEYDEYMIEYDEYIYIGRLIDLKCFVEVQQPETCLMAPLRQAARRP